MNDWFIVKNQIKQSCLCVATQPVRRHSAARLSILFVACCLAPTSYVIAQQGSLSDAQITSTMEDGLAAVQSEEWDKAISCFRTVAQSDSTQQQAIFYLGYSLHNAERFAEAIEFHKQASQFPRFSRIALYNWSCALALLGKKEPAISKLAEAVDAGFIHQIDIIADPDMASIIDHPEFEDLRRRATPFALRNVYQQFDFFLGEWDETDANGRLIGRSIVTRPEGSTMLTEQWTGRDGQTATGTTAYDMTAQQWIRTWGNSAGIACRYEGKRIGHAMTLSGRAFFANGKSVFQRLTLSPMQNGSVEKTVEQSTDGGIEWQQVYSGTYTRVPRQRAAE